MKFELHCHTTCSDGRLTPEELLSLAQSTSLDLLAVTDHDTVKAHATMEPRAERLGIRLLPGIELTTARNGESIHILGYFKDGGHRHPALRERLDTLLRHRDQRIQEMIGKLHTHFGLHVDYADLRKRSSGTLTRANLARALHANYPEHDYNETFNRYLTRKSPAYVPNVRLTVDEGIALLKEHGAVVVLAHPIIYKRNPLEELLDHDFDGVEAFYFLNDEGTTRESLTQARKRNLLVTAGSDYHGIPGDKKHGELASVQGERKLLEPFFHHML